MSDRAGDRWAKALDNARAADDRLRDRGVCPYCDAELMQGAMASLRAAVQLHEALGCPVLRKKTT